MNYYEILKKRRLDLNLSIADVSAQTRLAPEYIQAIEENNLDVFADDLSFVHYFIRSYCQAIGVNWKAIQEEVDGSIKYYAHMRNMALTQAQKTMAAQMPQASQEDKNRKPHAKKQSQARYQNRVNRTSKKLPGSLQGRHVSWKAVAASAAVVCLVVGVNYVSSQHSQAQSLAAETARQQELKAREEETSRLAQQRKEALGIVDQPDAPAPSIVVAQDGNEVSIEMSQPGALHLVAELPAPAHVLFYEGDTLLSDAETVYDSYSQDLDIQQDTVLTFQTTAAEAVWITAGGTRMGFQPDEYGNIAVQMHVQAGQAQEENQDEPTE